MDDDETRLVAETVSQILVDRDAALVPDSLLASGWFDLEPHDVEAVTATVFATQGRLGVASAALDLVALHALGVLEAGVAVLHSPMARQPDGTVGSADGAEVVVDGLLLAGYERASVVVAPVWRQGSRRLVSVAVQDLSPEPIGGFAPELRFARVRGRFAAEDMGGPPSGSWHLPSCRGAVAHELVGVAGALCEMMVDHVGQRVQFGRPLGARQAVKHRVAEVVVAISGAQAILSGLAGAETTELSAALAKAAAGRAALLAARHAQQVAGAIGFTVEHPLGGPLRRAFALDSFLGPSASLLAEIGRRLLERGTVPRPFSL